MSSRMDSMSSRIREGLWMGAVPDGPDHKDFIDIEGIYLLMPGVNACWHGFRTREEAVGWAKEFPGEWLVYENTAETIAARTTSISKHKISGAVKSVSVRVGNAAQADLPGVFESCVRLASHLNVIVDLHFGDRLMQIQP